jgi:glycogen synthase
MAFMRASMPAAAGGFVGRRRNHWRTPASKRVSSDLTHDPTLAAAAPAPSRPALRVLGFGWEFAPLLSGGLGVACAGLGRALVAAGVDLTFVLPKFPRPIASGAVRILDARESLPQTEPARGQAAGSTHVAHASFETRRIDSPLAPYQSPARYRSALEHVLGDRAVPGAARTAAAEAGADLYGRDLLAEVDRVAEAARSIAARIPHDVIHCHDWMTFAAGIAAREVSGRPLVLHVHSTEGDRSGGGTGNLEIRRFEAAGLAAADRVVAVSDFTRRKILEQYPGVAPARLRVVHNGIEPFDVAHVETPPLAAARPIVLFLGRLTAQKGPEWFLRAAELVHEIRPEALFVVAGTGELQPWMIEQAAERGLASSFLFTGFLSGADIARAYAMADVFVMPSVSEPFGLVPVEAMLRGTPVIVSRQSGVSEVIRHCLKVDFWDSEDLADKIVAVLDHPSLADDLSRAGLDEAGRMDWSGPARRLLEIFAEVVPAPDVQETGELP